MKKHYILTFSIILGLVISGLYFALMFQKWENKFTYQAEATIIQKPAPVPTEINENFMRQVNGCFIPTAKIYGYTLRIVSGYRTLDEQTQIYMQGRADDGDVVTEAPAGRSIHNYGYAVDVVDRWNGYDINWDKLTKIGEYCGLEHDPIDPPHFEERDGLTTDDFMYGRRPPTLSLPCSIMQDRADADKALTLSDLKSCGAPNFNSTK